MELSPGVKQEIAELEKFRAYYFHHLNHSPTLEAYYSHFFNSLHGQEVLKKIPSSKNLKVLDIGFGRGESSLWLASLGHQVFAIDPSPMHCELLNTAAKKFNLNNIEISAFPAEHLNHLASSDFDLCFFNSSLHHCDNPIQALHLCREKLKSTGILVATNEPLLKFYETKKRFFKNLTNNPIALAHYGGNEHIYSYREYVKMFHTAGFDVISHLHLRHLHPRQVLQENLSYKVDGRYVYSDTKLACKYLALLSFKNLLTQRLTKSLATFLAKKLSLFSFSFEATQSNFRARAHARARIP